MCLHSVCSYSFTKKIQGGGVLCHEVLSNSWPLKRPLIAEMYFLKATQQQPALNFFRENVCGTFVSEPEYSRALYFHHHHQSPVDFAALISSHDEITTTSRYPKETMIRQGWLKIITIYRLQIQRVKTT